MSSIVVSLMHSGVPIVEKVIRAAVVYVFLLLSLRLAGKRELGQLNRFDLVFLLLLANTVQNAIIGPDNSVVGAVVSGLTLLAVNYISVRFLYNHRKLDRLLEGDADLLVKDGQVREDRLAHELITRDELEMAAREQGISSLDEVQEARLEVGGGLSFVQKKPSDDELRHRELLERLSQLEERLATRMGG